MREPGFCGLIEAASLHELPRVAAGAVLVGIVGGEQQPIRADKGGGTFEIMRQEHPARRHIEISAQVRLNRMLQPRYPVHSHEPLGIEQNELNRALSSPPHACDLGTIVARSRLS
ncbi:hypothetical protein [Bosea sp. F3-2]|uniref:hypothetical protein n=1 Tax=Bosea sp. F3-2 TaxID=2599640 RepID=UPI001655A047|nr:hypothetical protein [Bosea sp. F3-2]